MKFVRHIRESKKLTRYGFAKLLGVNTQSIDNLEQGARLIRPILLCKLRATSGWSWEKFGAALDREFLEKEKTKK